MKRRLIGVSKESLAHKGLRAHKGYKAIPGHKGHRACKVSKALAGLAVHQGP